METSATSSCQLWLPDRQKSYGGGRFIIIRKVNTHWSGIKVDTQLDAIIGFLTNYILSSLQQSRASRFDSYSAYYISLHSLIGKTRTDMRVRLSLQGWVVSTHKLTLAERNLPSLLRNIFLVIKNNQRTETITRVFYRMYVGWGTLLSMGSVFRDGTMGSNGLLLETG